MPTTPQTQAQMESMIDQQVTNQTATRSITPSILGNLLKTMIAFIASFFVLKPQTGLVLTEEPEDKKISDMPLVAELTGDEVFPIVSNGQNKIIKIVDLFALLKEYDNNNSSTNSSNSSGSSGGGFVNILANYISICVQSQFLFIIVDSALNQDNLWEFIFSLRYQDENDQYQTSQIFRALASDTPNADGYVPIDSSAAVPDFFKDKIFKLPNQSGANVYNPLANNYPELGNENISIVDGVLTIRNPNNFNEILYSTDESGLPVYKSIDFYSFNQEIINNPPALDLELFNSTIEQFILIASNKLDTPMPNNPNAVKKRFSFTQAIPTFSDNLPVGLVDNCLIKITDTISNSYIVINVSSWKNQAYEIITIG